MTHGQYRRLRRWDLTTQPAYNAGVMDGMDARFCGNPRPIDPDEGYDSPFDLRFFFHPRKRYEQQVLNHRLARERGRVDGWDMAEVQVARADQEDWIDGQVADFAAQLDRWPTAKKAA